MIAQHFGLIEALFVFGLAIALYAWQMISLNRDIKARKERERKALSQRDWSEAPSEPGGAS